ncbi:hypothetical protein CONPUDRAFT_72086 [Coniophora puteana RWD-64-598 SS2]|uniref:Uncharacterized protein n=1 Tax=Coniophora puteana (strain RWD-64-598) TaxID=741705 RepID=A0A5M3MR52_CONPW|nr:uncharacterized protein CONPUDRAFT_72086 [Coniophora puteana RWD-64-598 SS2]EIW81663.1 hypothetical protein CONPUDRAFT_72086 [Coniophora puteana RWD-64-598 SS2]
MRLLSWILQFALLFLCVCPSASDVVQHHTRGVEQSLINNGVPSSTNTLASFFFWEHAVALENKFREYTNCELEKAKETSEKVATQITRIHSGLDYIINATAAARKELEQQMKLHDFTLEDFSHELEYVSADVLVWLQKEFPPMDEAPGHEGRQRIASSDVIEQHPDLATMVLFAAVGVILPESLFLKPIGNLFGWGPLGPRGGTGFI